MKIEHEGNSISLEFEIETDKRLPSYGDARVSVKICSHGFSGATSTWVFREELAEFYRSLRKLELERRGEAKLKSMSAEELEFRIYSTDSLGHMAVSGSIKSYFGDVPVHSMKFGFQIDPSTLVELAKLGGAQNA